MNRSGNHSMNLHLQVSLTMMIAMFLGGRASCDDTENSHVRLNQDVRDVLRWLPIDTETLISAQDFKISSPASKQDRLSIDKIGEFLTTFPRPAAFDETLRGRKVRWTLHGGRNTDIVSAFGSVRQEGASVIRFEDDLELETMQKLRNQLQENAEEVRRLHGSDVFVFPTNLDEMESVFKVKSWQGEFLVLLDRRTLITATSDVYLGELLARRKTKPEDQALPFSLPEWQYLDQTTDLWLLRHLPETNEQWDNLYPQEPRRLLGFVWMISSSGDKSYRAVYLPRPNMDIDDIARFPWTSDSQAPILPSLNYETSDTGIVTVEAALDDSGKPVGLTPESDFASSYFLFVLWLYSSQGLYR